MMVDDNSTIPKSRFKPYLVLWAVFLILLVRHTGGKEKILLTFMHPLGELYIEIMGWRYYIDQIRGFHKTDLVNCWVVDGGYNLMDHTRFSSWAHWLPRSFGRMNKMIYKELKEKGLQG